MNKENKKQITFGFFLISIGLLSGIFFKVGHHLIQNNQKVESLTASDSSNDILLYENTCINYDFLKSFINSKEQAELEDDSSTNCRIPFTYIVVMSLLVNISINCKKFMKLGSL